MYVCLYVYACDWLDCATRTESVHHRLADARDGLVPLHLVVAKALVARPRIRLKVTKHGRHDFFVGCCEVQEKSV